MEPHPSASQPVWGKESQQEEFYDIWDLYGDCLCCGAQEQETKNYQLNCYIVCLYIM